MKLKPKQNITFSPFSGPVPQSSAHPVELMTPDELDVLTSEPQLDYIDKKEDVEEDPELGYVKWTFT